ncbi:MAG: hypothetical protein Q8P89_03485 [bacterium]|nr:hypothetical protein [bacterium]
MKIIVGIILATTLILVGAVFLFSGPQESIPEEQIVTRSGLHWHPKLEIFIKGQKQDIPGSIGLTPVERPIHTHEADGVIHLEFPGLVKKDDLKLGQFFKIWGKEFNSNCIFDKCNGEEGKVKMTVNGQENQEFENYSMRDADQIEIRYE